MFRYGPGTGAGLPLRAPQLSVRDQQGEGPHQGPLPETAVR